MLSFKKNSQRAQRPIPHANKNDDLMNYCWRIVGFTLLSERRHIESAVYLLGEATIQLGFLSVFVCFMLFPRCSFLATVFGSGLLMKR